MQKKSTFIPPTKKNLAQTASIKNPRKAKPEKASIFNEKTKLAMLHSSNSFKGLNNVKMNNTDLNDNDKTTKTYNIEEKKKIKSDVGDDTDLDNRELEEPSHLFTPPHGALFKFAFVSKQSK